MEPPSDHITTGTDTHGGYKENMKTKLKWRLSKLPSPDELRELVKDKIITQEEAKSVLFETQNEEDVDTDALKQEIKFLRQVIEDLSKSRTETVRVIEKHINHYRDWYWYGPYVTWCSTGDTLTTTAGSGTTYLSGNSANATLSSSLSSIKTF